LTVPRKSVEKRGVKRSTQKKLGVPLCYFFSRSFLSTLSLRCECQYIRKVNTLTRMGQRVILQALFDLIGLMLIGSRSLMVLSSLRPHPFLPLPLFKPFISPSDSLEHPVLLTSVA
jgi:hypothetical protein